MAQFKDSTRVITNEELFFCTYYTHYITSNPAYTLAGIYADEGISAASTRSRTLPQFAEFMKNIWVMQFCKKAIRWIFRKKANQK